MKKREMKNSGIEWIGDVPADWGIVPLKRLAKIQTGNTPSKTEDNIYFSTENGYLWIKAENLGTMSSIETTTEYLTEEGIQAGRLFPENTVYVCCIASVGKVGFCTVPASCNQQINALIFHNAYWKYGFYLTVAQEAEYLLNASGNVMKIINSDKQSGLMCPFPPVEEQKRIAEYLDHQCAEIDAVIAKTKATIEEYKKLKQSVITEAVTKGIRGNRLMKESGIEWIGAFPKEWIFAELKMFCTVNNGKEILNEVDKDTEGAIGVYGSGGVFKYTDNYMFDGTTVMFGRKGTLGKPLHVMGKIWVVDTMYYLTYSTNLIPKFNYYQLCAFDWQPHITQTALPSIVASQIVACKFAIPDLQEQEEIITYLDKKCAEIDTLIEKKTALLAEMETYKKSVIYEYVTGKKTLS